MLSLQLLTNWLKRSPSKDLSNTHPYRVLRRTYPVVREGEESESREAVQPGFADRRHLVPVERKLLDSVQAEEGTVHQILDLERLDGAFQYIKYSHIICAKVKLSKRRMLGYQNNPKITKN